MEVPETIWLTVAATAAVQRPSASDVCHMVRGCDSAVRPCGIQPTGLLVGATPDAIVLHHERRSGPVLLIRRSDAVVAVLLYLTVTFD